MPEGDTIHKIVAVLAPALQGQALVRLWTRERGLASALAGSIIERVEAVGKHMLVAFGPTERAREAWMLRVHLGMHGGWYRNEPPVPRDRPIQVTDEKAVVLATAYDELVCYRAAQVELRHAADPVLQKKLGRIGPDLLAPECDMNEVLERARADRHAQREVGDVLLDQSIAAGIGNVYKSEVLFIERVHPQAPVQTLDDPTIITLFERSRELLLSNLTPGARSTVGELRGRRRRADTARLWVYRRAALPCLRCGTFILRMVQGDMGRSTYWCPACQRLPVL